MYAVFTYKPLCISLPIIKHINSYVIYVTHESMLALCSKKSRFEIYISERLMYT